MAGPSENVGNHICKRMENMADDSMNDLNRRMGPPVKPLPLGHKLIRPPALNGKSKGVCVR